MRRKTLIAAAGLVFSGFLASLLIASLLIDWPSSKEGPTPPTERQEPVATFSMPPSAEGVPPPKGEAAEKERALKVGVIGPETGEEAAYGLRVRDGILMAAKHFNAQGGVGGKDIEVLHYDNEGDPQETLQIASYLIQQNVMAIFSAPTGWSAFGPTRLANDSHTIFFAVGTRRRVGRGGGYVFHYSVPDGIAIDDLLWYSVNEAGYSNYALVTSSAYDYSLSISSLFKQAVLRHGGRILVEADTYDTFSGRTNLNGVIEILRNSPEPLHAIIYTGNGEEGARLAHAAREAGLMPPFIGSEDLFTESFLNQGGGAVKGTLLYATFAPDNDSPKAAEFIRDHGRENGGKPDRFTALAYDAFTQLAEAVIHAGSTKSSAVRNALLNRKEAEGATGKTSWTPEGAPLKHPFIYRIEEDGDGGKFVLLRQGGDR